MTPGADPDNIKGERTWNQVRVDKDWKDPTNLVQSVYMGFHSVQRIFSMHSMYLLGGLERSPKENFKN